MLAGGVVAAIIPRDHVEAARYAAAVWDTGLAPSSYKNKEQVMIGIMCGMELGLPPMQALSAIAIINGRPAVWGDGAAALCAPKVAKYWEGFEGEPNTDDYTAVVKIWRVGQPDEPYIGRFSIADAKRAKLWANASKDPWIKYPSIMQLHRARGFARRAGFADCLKGLALAEEVRDMEQPQTTAPVSTDFLSDDPPAQQQNQPPPNPQDYLEE